MHPIVRIAPFLFLLLLIIFASHGSAAPYHLYTYCPNNTFFPATNTALRANLDTLLLSLSSSANLSTTPGFNYTSTFFVSGLYLCRGDDDPSTCTDCVATASSDLSKNCPLSQQAIVWYDECMIRYSNNSFFSLVDTNIYLTWWKTANFTGNLTLFNDLQSASFAKVSTEAAKGNSTLKFGTDEQKLYVLGRKIDDYQKLYVLGQCTPDLSGSDCYRCLQACINYMPDRNSRGARVVFYSCNLRYEVYPLLVPVSLIFPIQTYCPNTALFPATNSVFRSNINALLLNLSVSANQSTNPGFQTDTVAPNSPTSVYGIYLCHGDVPNPITTCRDCVAFASVDLPINCPLGKQGVILYKECMVRYSNESFFGKLDPNLQPLGNITDKNVALPDAVALGFALGHAIDKLLANQATSGENGKMFWTANESISDNQTLYMLGQCTLDLSPADCSTCLKNCSSFLKSHITVGTVFYFNCNLRYSMDPFYEDPPNITISGNPAPTPKSTRLRLIIITCSVTGILLLFLVLALWHSVSKRKAKAGYTADLSDIATVESLQMDFTTIRAATQNFSIDRKVGQGGFGSVYKGTLENGQHIAVKRLSDNTRQGIAQFKTEALLVAKLQHRNLVKLLGFCISGKEMILVYEFLPNSSLDKILFDPTKRMSLTWENRFKIICGIAKGLMYLHEDSRLRVVHRDIKSSNILLDESMSPKIGDFGLAKHFSVDQSQDVTNTIAGTYGYMAPEYLLMGHYSIKSDVYSFGIIVLEVVSGQRNKFLNRPSLEEALIYRAWRVWHEGEALKMVDEALGDNYSREDVIKCIHIGLLCIQESVARRPDMTSTVAALGGQSITLPLPSPPNFFSGSNPTSSINTQHSGDNSGQGVSILNTSEITELHVR